MRLVTRTIWKYSWNFECHSWLLFNTKTLLFFDKFYICVGWIYTIEYEISDVVRCSQPIKIFHHKEQLDWNY